METKDVKKQDYKEVKNFPEFPDASVVVTDWDDTIQVSRNEMWIKQLQETGSEKPIPEDAERPFLEGGLHFMKKCEEDDIFGIIFTSAQVDAVKAEWTRSTKRPWPACVQIISTKAKGRSLVHFLKGSLQYMPDVVAKTKKRPKVNFIDDSQLHIEQVLAVKHEVEELGFDLDIFHIVADKIL